MPGSGVAKLTIRGDFVKPSDYPVGSIESRAAARAFADLRDKGIRRVHIVNDIPKARAEISVGDWLPDGNGALIRVLNVPHDIDKKTLEELLARP